MNRVIALAIYSTLLFGPAASLAKDKSAPVKDKTAATKDKTADVVKDKPTASTSAKPAAQASAKPAAAPAATPAPQATAKPAASPGPAPAPQATANPAAQVVELTVTKSGFVPAEIKVKAGQPVKLMVTRKIEQTCAKDIVIKDFNIKQALPLNQTVEVQFTPSKPGAARFACAMDMVAGVIIAE